MEDTTGFVVERLHGAAPILTKIESHPWEGRVAFNPACALLTEREWIDQLLKALPLDANLREELRRRAALVCLLYRAQGSATSSYDHTRSSVGLAILSPDLEPLARVDHPVILPQEPYENLGVEDPRITRIGDRYVMSYTAYASGPQKNHVRIAIASSTNFMRWTKHGVLDAPFNTLDNKNGMLFEPARSGPLLMLHRPMEGTDAMMIHWAEGDAIQGRWRDRGVLLRPIPDPEFRDVWLGGGAPPLLLEDGRYLVLYHIGKRRADGTREYDLGLALLDPRAREPIVRRLEPLLRPQTTFETVGDAGLGVNNVVFVCGAYFWNGDLYFPYAGADTCVLAARIPRAALETFV